MLGMSLTIEGRRGRVVLLGPLLLLTETPGWFFVGVWFVLQLVGLSESQSWLPTENNIAWLAHLGGFAAGVVCGLAVLGSRRVWQRSRGMNNRAILETPRNAGGVARLTSVTASEGTDPE